MKTLLGFRNMKQIDCEISKINMAIAISESNINEKASATVSHPSLSDVHSQKKHQDSIFINFIEDVKNIRKQQCLLKKRLEFITSIKNAIITSINLSPDDELSKIFKAYFVDNTKVDKIASDMSISAPSVYKQINKFYDSVNKLSKPMITI